MRFRGKVAVVTGAANGIGEKTAARLASEGCRVVIADIDEMNGERVAAHINSSHPDPSPSCSPSCSPSSAPDGPTGSGGSGSASLSQSLRECETPDQHPCIFVRCDVRRREDIAAVFARAEGAYGGLDIVVNNAATQNVKPILETSPEEWDDVIATNLSSVFHSLQLSVPYLQRRGGGTVVNVSSTFAVVGSPGYAAYHASKGGVSSLTRAAAVGLLEHKIRVNAVCPGTTLTPGLVQGVERTCTKESSPDQLMQSFLSKQPLGRFGLPDEIAHVIAFLASDESSFIVGACVMADGAYTVV